MKLQQIGCAAFISEYREHRRKEKEERERRHRETAPPVSVLNTGRLLQNHKSPFLDSASFTSAVVLPDRM